MKQTLSKLIFLINKYSGEKKILIISHNILKNLLYFKFMKISKTLKKKT